LSFINLIKSDPTVWKIYKNFNKFGGNTNLEESMIYFIYSLFSIRFFTLSFDGLFGSYIALILLIASKILDLVLYSLTNFLTPVILELAALLRPSAAAVAAAVAAVPTALVPLLNKDPIPVTSFPPNESCHLAD
jgi:hypothetical protein